MRLGINMSLVVSLSTALPLLSQPFNWSPDCYRTANRFFFRLGTYHNFRDTVSQYITVVVSFKEFGRLLNTVGFHHRWFAPLQWVPEVPLRPSGDRWTQKGRPRTASTVVCSHSEQGIFGLGVGVFFRKRTVKFRSTLVTRNRGRSKRGVFARAQLLKMCSYV